MKDIGRKPIIDERAWLRLQSESPADSPSLPLGTNEVTLIDITTGYATFANGGKAVKPYTVLEIRRPNGDLLYSRERNAPRRNRPIPAEKVAELDYMLDQRGSERDRPAGASRLHATGRQDRHQPGLSRRLVHRLHRPLTSRACGSAMTTSAR